MNKLAALLISALALTACDDGDAAPDVNDGITTRAFRLRIENVAPWTVLKAGTQPTRTDLTDGAIGPGEAFEIRFTAGQGHVLSFAAMLVESNDWFFAPGPEGIALYSDGSPLAGEITRLVRLWDAGTERDQEPGVGAATALLQPTRDVGEPDPDAQVREVPLSPRLTEGGTFVRPEISDMIRVTLTPGPEQQFTLRIENVSTPATLVTSQGTLPVHVSPFVYAVHRAPGALFEVGVPARENGLEQLAEAGQPDPLGASLRNARGAATALSPGVVVVHEQPAPLFAPGSPDLGAGLERLAEDGNPAPLHEALRVSPPPGVISTTTFETPVGSELAGPALPGQAYEVIIEGRPGEAVSFATMFGMSNDWLFATRPEGIALFFDGVPRSCDVTSDVALYDLGTEADEELDVGPNTAPQQPVPDTGRADRVTEVREVTIERYGVPQVLHLRVTLTPLTL